MNPTELIDAAQFWYDSALFWNERENRAEDIIRCMEQALEYLRQARERLQIEELKNVV